MAVSEAFGQRFGGQGGIHFYLKTCFKCLLIETSTDTHIFKYSNCILFIFKYFLHFSPILMKSCFPFPTSIFREMSQFSISRKTYGFSVCVAGLCCYINFVSFDNQHNSDHFSLPLVKSFDQSISIDFSRSNKKQSLTQHISIQQTPGTKFEIIISNSNSLKLDRQTNKQINKQSLLL